MKVCPNCQTKYPEDSNFCPQETCATPDILLPLRSVRLRERHGMHRAKADRHAVRSGRACTASPGPSEAQ